MPEQLTHVQLREFEDLIRLVSLSPAPFIEHLIVDGKNVYFIHTGGLFGPPMIYYVERGAKIDKKYVVFNRYKDEVSFSDSLGTDPQAVYIPVLEIERTSLFSKYPP